jgi:hypothetical protein
MSLEEVVAFNTNASIIQRPFEGQYLSLELDTLNHKQLCPLFSSSAASNRHSPLPFFGNPLGPCPSYYQMPNMVINFKNLP